jgi:Rieske Fe-S protein
VEFILGDKMIRDEEKTSRRSLLDWLLHISIVASAVSVFYPIFAFFKIPPEGESVPVNIVAAKVNELQVNQGKVFRFGNAPAILVRTPDGNWKAFSAVCTHLQCTVQYRTDLQKVWCACHNGIFDLNGGNISGPPPRPLQEFKVTTKGDDVIVSKA